MSGRSVTPISEKADHVLSPSSSLTAAASRAQGMQRQRDALARIPRAALGAAEQFAYDVYIYTLDQELALADYALQYEPLLPETGVQCALPLSILGMSIKNAQDAQSYLQCLRDFPRDLQEVLDWERERAAAGIFMTERALAQVLDDLARAREASFLQTLREAFAADLAALSLPDAENAALIAEQDALLQTHYVAGLHALAQGLDALRGDCRADVGQRALGVQSANWFGLALRKEASTQDSPATALELLEEYRDTLLGMRNFLQELHPLIPLPVSSLWVADAAATIERFQTDLPGLPAFSRARLRSFALGDAPLFTQGAENSVICNSDAPINLLLAAQEIFPGRAYFLDRVRDNTRFPAFQRCLSFAGQEAGWSANAARMVARAMPTAESELALMQHFDDMYLRVQGAICSLLVNEYAYARTDLASYLAEYGLDAQVDAFWARAVDQPLANLSAAIGYCKFLELEETFAEQYYADPAAYYTAILELGPAPFSLLRSGMEAWANG
jgi:uncharacterized protein (DUF885 family)